MGVFAGESSLFGIVPILLWCLLAGYWRTGAVVGLILLVLLVWFTVPRELGWSGPWVPSSLELFWLHPLLASVVCLAGLAVERRMLAGVWLLTMVLIGFVGTVLVLLWQHEAKPGDEGVVPGPAGVRIVEGAGRCGSGGCARELTATGDRAIDVMRAHLTSRGFGAAPPLSRDERMCRVTGLAVEHEVCAELRVQAANSVRVVWYVNRS